MLDEPFAATPESIRRHARRFEIATWLFLATMSVGLGYALWKGTSFFPALRQAQFQFAELEQADNVAGFVPFVNGVIATWPERLAAFPATRVELVAIALAFVLGMAAFRIVCKAPAGILILEADPDCNLLRERVQRALELTSSEIALFVRTDGGLEAGYSKKKNAAYLPAEFVQKLYRKYMENAPEQLAFLIVHERTHGSSSDNFLWSWGRSLAFLLTAMSATLIASPIMMATAAAIPARLVQVLPFPLAFGLVMLFIALFLGFTGAVTNGVLPNLTAARELFADALAAHTPEIGPHAMPYEATTDISRRGDMAAGWSMRISGPDRRLHARGIAPRAGALAASTVAMWLLVRTLILMLDPMAWHGMVWAFDAAYLTEVATMLYSLPRRRAGARDYGLLSWVSTIVLSALIALSFALIDRLGSTYGMASIINPSWLAAVAIPPIVVAAAILLWQRATAIVRHDLDDIDRLSPRHVGIGRLIQLVAAVPSYVWSYTMAGLALFTWCTTLAAWGSGGLFSTQAFMVDVVSLAICAMPALIVVKNFRALSRWSAAAEALSAVMVLTFVVYATMIMRLAASRMPPPDSGPPFDFGIFLQVLLSPPAHLVIITLGIAAVVGAVLLASWEMRYRLLTHRPLFTILGHRPSRPGGSSAA